MELPPKPSPHPSQTPLESKLAQPSHLDAQVGLLDAVEARITKLERDLANINTSLRNLIDDFQMRFPSAQTRNCLHCGAMIRSKAGNCTTCGRKQ